MKRLIASFLTLSLLVLSIPAGAAAKEAAPVNLAAGVSPEIAIGGTILTDANAPELLALGGNYDNFVTSPAALTDGAVPENTWIKGQAWFYGDPNNAAEIACDVVITLDLGVSAAISGYSLYSGNAAEQWEIDNSTGSAGKYKSKAVHDWKVEVSADKTQWAAADTVTGNTTLVLDKTIPSATARYIRFSITKWSKKEAADVAMWDIMGLSEIKVMGVKGFTVPAPGDVTPPAADAYNLLAGRIPDCFIDGVKLTAENESTLLDLGALAAKKGSLGVITDGINDPANDTEGKDSWQALYRDSDADPTVTQIDCDINLVWDLGKEFDVSGYAFYTGSQWKQDMIDDPTTDKKVVQDYKAGAATAFVLYTSSDGVEWTAADTAEDNDKLVYKKDFSGAKKTRFVRLHITTGPKMRIPASEYLPLVGGFWKTVRIVEIEAYQSGKQPESTTTTAGSSNPGTGGSPALAVGALAALTAVSIKKRR